MRYPALIEKLDGWYVVNFRDVPEAITQGRTMDEAVDMAKDALSVGLSFYIESNKPLPEPSKKLHNEVYINSKDGTMNKKEVVKELAKRTGNTEVLTITLINEYHKLITEELAKGGDVRFVGFGSYATRKRRGRDGRNPKTGEKLHIPAKTVPVFKPGKALKDAVDK